MNLVHQSAFLKALGWSLLDSLWQMGVLWLMYVLLTANGKRLHARQRHNLALLSLAGGSLWFVVTLVINFYKAVAAPEVIRVVVIPRLPTQWLEPALPFVSVAYLLIISLLFVRFYHQYRYTRRLSQQGLQKAHVDCRLYLQQAVEHLSIPRKVTIWMSSLVSTPLTIGFWKPIILLPVAAVNNLTIQQVEAIILHELYHIKRNDYLLNLLVAFTDIILFFNPFAQLLSATIRREREHSCDDIVLQFRYNATEYARALLTLEQNRTALTPALTIPATGKDQPLLLNRVKRMLTNEPAVMPVSQKLVAYLLSALLIGFIGFYNPGRAIVTTIEEVAVNAPESPATELPLDISTPTPSSVAMPLATVVETRCTEAAPNITETVNKEKEDGSQADADEEADQEEAITEVQAKLAALALKQVRFTQQMVNFAGSPEIRDFSMQATGEALAAVAGSIETHPYVPGNSFSVQLVEDTTRPKAYVMSASEKEAKEALDKALKGLQAIDWQKIEKEIKASAGQVNVKQLQDQLKKAIKEVDWKKINSEVESSLQDAQEELAQEKVNLQAELERYKAARQQKQDRMVQLQTQVLMNRLQETEKPADCDKDKEKKTKSVKPVVKRKIVII
jgi:beta-lactamase regulating signal transducer with metallopeptidase domain